MKLLIVLPQAELHTLKPPKVCPYPGCNGKIFWPIQKVSKRLRDPVCDEITVYRYLCLCCKRTFRVYPAGVSRDRFSQRVKKLVVLCNLFGLSCRSTALLLKALGVPISKTTVYLAVQEALTRAPDLKGKKVVERALYPGLENGKVSVKINGRWYPVEVELNQFILNLDGMENEEVMKLAKQLQQISELLDAKVMFAEQKG